MQPPGEPKEHDAVNLPMMFKFCKKKNLVQPQGEPWKHPLDLKFDKKGRAK